MPKKKLTASKRPLSVKIDEWTERELQRCLRAWRAGSIPALVDALILCHRERKPMPLWVAQGAISLIKVLFKGKTLRQRGRLGAAPTRYRSYLIDYARWDAVKELEDRRDEIPAIIAGLPKAEQARCPQFVALRQDFSLEQRCSAVAECFQLKNDPAKGKAGTIQRSYKRVNRDLNRGVIGQYHLPQLQNPLRSTYDLSS